MQRRKRNHDYPIVTATIIFCYPSEYLLSRTSECLQNKGFQSTLISSLLSIWKIFSILKKFSLCHIDQDSKATPGEAGLKS